jgi:hypothetical protein
MSDKERTSEHKALAETEVVQPKTMNVNIMAVTFGEDRYNFAEVIGGREQNVWLATFADPDEAQAWVQGNNHFGQGVRGVIRGKGKTSGVVSKEAGGGCGRGSREAAGDAGGSGSPSIIPTGSISLHGGNEVGGGCDSGSASAAPTQILEG